MIVRPPLYLAIALTSCWKCNAALRVAGLVASNVDDEESDGLPCLLSDIDTLPSEILDFIQARVPSFRLAHSHTMGYEYYGNVCPTCDALSGDWYMHKLGGPLSPLSTEDARRVRLLDVPMAEDVEIESTFHVGNVEVLLEGAERITEWDPSSLPPQQR